MHFFSLDVETANYDSSTICQIGIGEFRNGEVVSTWESLIDPQSVFHYTNVRIHGITEEMVEDAPTFADVYPVLKEMLTRKGGVLSGGQQQQLAIGRALLTSPRLLILDEPTEGIQPSIIDHIGDTLKKLKLEELRHDLLGEIASAVKTLDASPWLCVW